MVAEWDDPKPGGSDGRIHSCFHLGEGVLVGGEDAQSLLVLVLSKRLHVIPPILELEVFSVLLALTVGKPPLGDHSSDGVLLQEVHLQELLQSRVLGYKVSKDYLG